MSINPLSTHLPAASASDLESIFSIALDPDDAAWVLARWQQILRSSRWTEGDAVAEFEAAWAAWNGVPAAAFNSWAGPAWGAMEFAGVRDQPVLCPSNTFAATPQAIIAAGGVPIFYDCNREDLCGRFEDFVRKAEAVKPRAAWLVHIGGHIAFDSQRIADYCREKGIFLAEDCAHAHGAEWFGRKPGTWGDVGIYSFYATKTISSGEGGIAVSNDPTLMSYLRAFREYGKNRPEGPIGLNFRMTEFAAALATAQTRRMPEHVAYKQRYARDVLDQRYPSRMRFPEGMSSGYYKYIIFDRISGSTGRVYDTPCHRLYRQEVDLPNTDWVAENHSCVPIYVPRRVTKPPSDMGRSDERGPASGG